MSVPYWWIKCSRVAWTAETAHFSAMARSISCRAHCLSLQKCDGCIVPNANYTMHFTLFLSMRRHGARNADYRGGVTCLYDTQLLGACLHASECGGRSRPGAVRGMPDVPIAPPATGPPEGWAAVGFVSPASFNRGLCAVCLGFWVLDL